MVVNALIWAWGAYIPTEILDTVYHDYGDNGIYDCYIQVIDDDIWWDLSGPQPVFRGTGDPADWISEDDNHFPIEVLNVDPWISREGIQARIAMDLVIRVTGEPGEMTYMNLWRGGYFMGGVSLDHQGNQQYATLPAVLNMGNINEYWVEVIYTGTDGGARPTWVFQGRFSTGHTKELKKVMKEGDNYWKITADQLKLMIVGEPIVFTAQGDDVGSDDLAFWWQYGDGGEDIHVWANADNTMAVGEPCTLKDLFNAHPSRDPDFVRPVNDVRSPLLKPMSASDEAVHAFEESGFYLVTLTMPDDDVGDGYPSFQFYNEGGGYDMEYYEVDLMVA
jgi:hypothetical protein